MDVLMGDNMVEPYGVYPSHPNARFVFATANEGYIVAKSLHHFLATHVAETHGIEGKNCIENATHIA